MPAKSKKKKASSDQAKPNGEKCFPAGPLPSGILYYGVKNFLHGANNSYPKCPKAGYAMSENGVYINPLDGCAIFTNIKYLEELDPADNRQTFKASGSESQAVIYGKNLKGQFAISEDGLIRPPKQDWYSDPVTDAHWPAASLEVSADPPHLPGSAGHCIGTCKPCIFYHTETACKFADRCHFCHVCPPGETKKRRHIKIRRFMDVERVKKTEPDEPAEEKPAEVPEPVPEVPQIPEVLENLEPPKPKCSPDEEAVLLESDPLKDLESDPLKEYLQQLMVPPPTVPSIWEARKPCLGSLGSLDTCWGSTNNALNADEWPELVKKTLLIYDKKSA